MTLPYPEPIYFWILTVDYDFYLTRCGGHNEKETLSDILLNTLST